MFCVSGPSLYKYKSLRFPLWMGAQTVAKSAVQAQTLRSCHRCETRSAGCCSVCNLVRYAHGKWGQQPNQRGMQLLYRESAGPPRTTSWPVTTRTGFSGFRAPSSNPRREVVTVPLSDSKSRASREMMFSAPSCSGQLLVENASLTGFSPRKRRAPTPPCA